MSGKRSGGRFGVGLGAWMRRRRRGRQTADGDLVALCRDLRLDGWEHLATADGAVVVTAGDPGARHAPWHTVAFAIASWAGPLALLAEDEGNPVDRELLERLGVAGPADEIEARQRLERGERLLALAAGSGIRSAASATAGTSLVPADAARVAESAGAPLLFALLAQDADGRLRLTLRPA